jgi:hypothetical protein
LKQFVESSGDGQYGSHKKSPEKSEGNVGPQIGRSIIATDTGKIFGMTERPKLQ